MPVRKLWLHLFLAVTMLGSAGESFAQKDDSTTKAMGNVLEVKPEITHGFKPAVNINPFYRLYVGAGYNIVSKNENDVPYSSKHTIGLNYAVLDHSFHPYYRGHFPQVIGQWNLSVLAGYDQLRRLNYFGLGNETRRSANEDFDLVRTHHQYAGVGVEKHFDKHHVDVSIFYNATQVQREDNRLSLKSLPAVDPAVYTWEFFVGPRLSYTYTRLDELALPSKGFEVTTALSYTKNMERSGHSFSRAVTGFDLYTPLPGRLSVVNRVGFAYVTGNPDFYQMNMLGGSSTLRGFRRGRFYGKTAFYNQNELRWITETDKKFISGRIGLVALLDQGRVWLPGEQSDKMHFGYGGGFIVTLMNKYVVTTTYAFSNDDRRLNFKLRKLF